MATAFDFGNSSGRGNDEIDLIDVAALILVPITGAMIFGVFSLGINVFGGYDFTSPIWTIGGASISAALLITVFGVLWIVFTNLLNDQTEHETEELAAVAVALFLPIGFVFVPAIEAVITWHDLMQLAATLYLSAASVYASYKA